MKPFTMAGILIVLLGVLGLAGGSLRYRRAVSREMHRPPEMRHSVQSKLVVPLVGSLAILTGIVMLAVGERPQNTLL
jgi:uncharacterized membrane protein YidH (DUF202 family)